MSVDNWSRILCLPGGIHHEAIKWITYQINGFDLDVMNDYQVESAQGLIAELRRLLEELNKMEGMDDWSRLALKDEIQGIRAGDIGYWWKVLGTIKEVQRNQSTTPTPAPGNQSPIDIISSLPPPPYSEFGTTHDMIPAMHPGHPGYPSGGVDLGCYESCDSFLLDVGEPYGSGYSATRDGQGHLGHPETGGYYYTPSETSMTSPSPSEMYYQGESSESMEGMDSPPPAASVLQSIQSHIEDVRRDIHKWNLEAENKERNLELMECLDNHFLNSVEVKSSRIVSQLVQIQTPEAVKMLEDFVSRLLVITKQPERVIQYKERFTTSVRFLLGKDIVATSPKANTVTLKVINQELKDPLEKGLGGIPQGKLERTGNGLVAELMPMIPKNPKRLNKTTHPEILRVQDESFYVHYTAKIKLQNYGKLITATAYSHPVKITVNSKQDANAWETVIWDNAADRFGICPCISRPQSLPFKDVVNALNAYFKDTDHGFELRDYEVVFGILNPRLGPRFQSDNGREHITLAKFRVEQEVGGLNLDLKDTRKISYWGWFFYLKKFILAYVRDLFRDGAMLGYLTQAESRKELCHQPEGTFLIRFSNSSPNAVTVEWNDPGSADKKPGIYSYRGSGTDLVLRSLKDRIMDSSRWKVHHPSKLPKETMVQKFPVGFASHGRRDQDSEDQPNLPRLVGYVKAFLRAKLDFN